MRKWFLLIMTVLVATALVACDGGEQGGEGEEFPEQITIWADNTYWGGANEELVVEMVSAYEEETGIKVIYEALPSLRDRINGSFLGGEAPDVIIWDRWETPSYVREQKLVNLKQYIEADEIDLSDYQEVALAEMTYEGGIYGLPLDIDAWGYWVNKTMVNEANDRLRAAGKPEVKVLPTTWDELRDTAIATTQFDSSGKMTVAGLNVNTPGAFFSYMQTAGGKLLATNDKGQVVANFNNEYGHAVIKYWFELIHEHKVYDAGISSTVGGADDPFIAQKIAIQSNSLLNGAKFYDMYIGDDFEYEFIPFPKGPSAEFVGTTGENAGSNGGGLMGGFGLAVPLSSKNQKAGYNLIKWWLTDTEKVVRWSEISQLIPAKLSVIEELRTKDIPNVRNVLDVLPDLKIRPQVDGYPSVETGVFMAVIPTVLFGDAFLKGNPELDDRIYALLASMERSANDTFRFAEL